jgi:hypothetical protein
MNKHIKVNDVIVYNNPLLPCHAGELFSGRPSVCAYFIPALILIISCLAGDGVFLLFHKFFFIK